MIKSTVNMFKCHSEQTQRVSLTVGVGNLSYPLLYVTSGSFTMGGNGPFDDDIHEETILHPYYIGIFGKNGIEDGYQSVTYDVGIFKPNELGLYDMNSNVAEWCKCTNDFNENYLLKGGVLGFDGGLIWEECSIAERISESADSYTPNKGLRLVINI